MTNKKIGIEELIRRAGRANVIPAILAGKISLGQKIREEDFEKFQRDIKDIVSNVPKQHTVFESGEVHILCLYNQARQLKYLTLVQDGQPEITIQTQKGDIDWEKLEENALCGFDSLDAVFQEAFEDSLIPIPERRKPSKIIHRKRPDGGSNKPRKQRSKPYFLIDPTLREFLIQKAQFLSYTAFAKTTGARRAAALVDREDLEVLLPSTVLDICVRGGYRVSMQTAIDFVADNRNSIMLAQRRKLRDIINDERVVNKVNEYFEHLKRKEGNSTKALLYLETPSNGRHGYDYFSEPEHKVEGMKTENLIDALRNITAESVSQERDGREQMRRHSLSMHSWVAIAKAADFVEQDKYIATEVTPLFSKVKERDAQEKSVSEIIYEGMRRLLKKVTDRKLHYSVSELDFIIKGLWYHGYFMKESGSGIEEADEETREVYREIRGVNTQFIYPARHLMRRFGIYDAVLAESLEKLVKGGRMAKSLKLDSQENDGELGLLLYEGVPERKRNETFVHLTTNKPLVSPGALHGNMMRWILEYYVGIKRDQILEKVRRHYGQ